MYHTSRYAHNSASETVVLFQPAAVQHVARSLSIPYKVKKGTWTLDGERAATVVIAWQPTSILRIGMRGVIWYQWYSTRQLSLTTACTMLHSYCQKSRKLGYLLLAMKDFRKLIILMAYHVHYPMWRSMSYMGWQGLIDRSHVPRWLVLEPSGHLLLVPNTTPATAPH